MIHEVLLELFNFEDDLAPQLLIPLLFLASNLHKTNEIKQ
jgi:hypothetical protein